VVAFYLSSRRLVMSITIAIAGAVIFLLSVRTWYQNRYLEYRAQIPNAERLLSERFEVREPVGKPPQYFLQGRALSGLEKHFAVRDANSLTAKGILRRVEFVKGNRVIPETPEFHENLRAYKERLFQARKEGEKRIAAMALTAPYDARREFYIDRKIVHPVRSTEQTFA
jgi:hypothetical protein